LLGDSCSEGTSGLEVVQARFAGRRRSSFEDLVSGYSSMRVLTYSNSVSMIGRAAELLDRMEIVFGCEDVIGSTAAYFQFQEQLIKELVDEVRGKDALEQKISSGDVRLYVATETVNHEKLFLLEGERGRRVITGSANFSERAFSGRQNESYICFEDDPEAWEYFDEKYERIKAASTTSISKRAVLAGGFSPEHLPALSFEEDSGGITVAVGKPPAPSVVHKVIVTRPSRKYEGMSQVIPSRNGRANIDLQRASRAIRYIKSNSRTEGANPEEYLSVYPESGEVVVSGVVLDLEPEKPDVARDVRLLLEYFRGYENFRGDAKKLARDYFTFMAWLYAGPFVCDLRNAALSREEHVLDYPTFGILYGKSNCGKSELVRTLLVSMFQREGFLKNEWFTRTRMEGLMVQNKRYPLAFDDLDRTRFNTHAVALIKDDYLTLDEYPVTVLSMNAEQDTFGTEVRKRALIFYTNASLPDHVGESRKLASDVRRTRRELGNALYREYLRRALVALREERSRDILAFSSEILHGIFAEHCEGELPAWCRITSMADYERSKHDKVRDELLQLMRHAPDAWKRDASKVVLRLADIHDLRKLKKDVPDYLLASGSRGNALVFEARDLEEFLGRLPLERPGLSGLLARLFKGRG
jgi:hypothetical protein